MKFLNVEIPVKNLPELDGGFVPLGLFFKQYQKGAKKPLCIAVERSGGQIGTYETKVYGTPDMAEADTYYVDRLVKFLLWSWGGFKVYICGDEAVGARIRQAYTAGGSRSHRLFLHRHQIIRQRRHLGNHSLLVLCNTDLP